jgi:hypothetical protein
VVNTFRIPGEDVGEEGMRVLNAPYVQLIRRCVLMDLNVKTML